MPYVVLVVVRVLVLSPAELTEFESCFASMPILVSVFLQFGAAVLVSYLPQRDAASIVELLQNPTSPLLHHGYSNAVAVLIYADHILSYSCSWRILLEQHEETVARGHQDARSNPTIINMLEQSFVGSVLLDGQTETLMVSPHTQSRVSCMPPTP
jgi:hypothetical protein